MNLLLPGAKQIPSAHNGGSMVGTGAYVTWHTYECAYTVSATAGARALIVAGNEVTLCFNPVTGEVVQILSAGVAARGLQNLSGGVETNRRGKIHVQIEVIGKAAYPWTNDLTPAGKATLKNIILWLDQLGVPRIAPNGNYGPRSYYESTTRSRSIAAWLSGGGYFCHGDAPENVHWDHGYIYMPTLWSYAPVGAVPGPGSAIPSLPPKIPADPAKVKRIQVCLELTADGQWGPNTDLWAMRMRTASRAHAGYPTNIMAPFSIVGVQNVIDTIPDGSWGPNSQRALIAWIKTMQTALRVIRDGSWGPGTDGAFLYARKQNLNNY